MPINGTVSDDMDNDNDQIIKRVMSLFDGMTDTYYRTDADGKLTFISNSLENLL
ncbi:MAG: hypothetical protein HQ503_06110, partial [Rhodospirillales bacterium]|nr:hypothetical protein [Rhodospirillales bacterium]